MSSLQSCVVFGSVVLRVYGASGSLSMGYVAAAHAC